MRRDRVRFFAQRVDQIAGAVLGLGGARDDLETDRTRRIVAIDERQVVRRDAQAQPVGLGAPRPLELVGRQPERGRERVDGRDRARELAHPRGLFLRPPPERHELPAGRISPLTA